MLGEAVLVRALAVATVLAVEAETPVHLYWRAANTPLDGAILVVAAADGPMPQTGDAVRAILLHPDLEALTSGKGRMTLDVPDGKLLRALKRAFDSREPLGGLELVVGGRTWNVKSARITGYHRRKNGAIIACDFNYE